MNKSQNIELYDQDQRKDVEYPDMRREVTANVVRHIDTSGAGAGTVIYSQPSASNRELEPRRDQGQLKTSRGV